MTKFLSIELEQAYADSEKRRRRRRRLNYLLPAVDQETAQPLGHVADIHMEGMRLVCNEPVLPGTHFNVSLPVPLPQGGVGRALVDTESVWVRMAENPAFWDVGLRITSASPEALQGIERLIRRLAAGRAERSPRNHRVPADQRARSSHPTYRREGLTQATESPLERAKSAVEDFPHIVETLTALWGSRECHEYLSKLILLDRPDRKGLPKEVLEELLFLHNNYATAMALGAMGSQLRLDQRNV